MNKFQAAVSASANRPHIYRVGDDPRMALCGRTVCVLDYKETLSFRTICKPCAVEFVRCWVEDYGANERPEATALGVSELIL